MPAQDPSQLTPEGFEQFVRATLDQEGVGLEEYRSQHLESIQAPDGSYTFDVTARFAALGADFLVVVECKRWSQPIERELVQALEQKRQSVRAQKAMMFTTSDYRRGAVEFATAHRIALVVIRGGESAFQTRSQSTEHPYQSWLPRCVAWLVQDKRKSTSWSIMGQLESPFGTHGPHGYLLKFVRNEPDEEPQD